MRVDGRDKPSILSRNKRIEFPVGLGRSTTESVHTSAGPRVAGSRFVNRDKPSTLSCNEFELLTTAPLIPHKDKLIVCEGRRYPESHGATGYPATHARYAQVDRFLTIHHCPVRTNIVRSENAILGALREHLIARRLPRAGSAFLQASQQMAIEPTCLALLALRQDQRTNAQSLLGAQRPDGSWGAFATDDGPSGLTGLALLTLNSLGTFPEAANRAAHWLLQVRGREASRLWKWKFRTTDTRVRFDPDKFGWPWQPGTCSWVVPTAFAVLALKQSFPCCRRGQIADRIQRGVEMLLDRACPNGGWNAGNGVVYGTPMKPHLDATAIALLALRSEPRQELIERGLAWLRLHSSSCSAPWSLAWSILALDAYNDPVSGLQERLAALAEGDSIDDSATLAIVTLALDCGASGNPFEVIA